MRRRIPLVAAVVLGIGAVLLAVWPFTGRVSFDGATVLGVAGLEGARGIEGHCGPPIVSLWREPGPDDALPWTVTLSTSMEGATGYASAGSLGRWCADDARRRMIFSVSLAMAAAAAGLLARRTPPRGAEIDDPDERRTRPRHGGHGWCPRRRRIGVGR